jgi:hypothetical protein
MKTWALNERLTSADLNSNFAELVADLIVTRKQANPIGSIIPFYDFNGDLTYDSSYYAVCNGQSKTIAGSSRTLPDLSGRYLVGFGTDGGEDIGSASWETAKVGVDNHQVNLYHRHTETNHAHNLTSNGGANIMVSKDPTGNTYIYYQSHARTTPANSAMFISVGTPASGSWSLPSAVTLTGRTEYSGSMNTGYGLSSTQSIQPSSIRVRYLMRIL